MRWVLLVPVVAWVLFMSLTFWGPPLVRCKLGNHRPLEWEYRIPGVGGGKAHCGTCGKEGLVDSNGDLF